MNILIDIGHPAHVHYFKNLYHKLKTKHKIVVTCKSVGLIKNLLTHYEMPFIELGKKGDNVLSKIGKQAAFTKSILQVIKQENIELCIGVSATIVHASKLAGIDSVLFDDDDQGVQPFTKLFVTPHAKSVLSPNALQFERLKNAIYYPGFHELAYLHPDYFKANPTMLSQYGLNEGDDYFVLRFNAFKAHHDIKEGGMTLQQKRALINLLKSKGKVFITTEAEIDPEFEEYKLPIPAHEIHDFLFFAKLFVSDSQTMTSEAAVLGVPSFRCNSFAGRLSVIEEEEKKYGLTLGFLPRQFDWMLYRIKETLEIPNLKEHWAEKRQKMLADKIDVTKFWLWFIENYPKSKDLAKRRDFDYNQFK